MFPPGPHGSLLLGNLPEIRRDPLAFLARVRADHGDIAHVRLGPFHVFVLNHPDDIEQVLVTQHDRFVKGRSLAGARRLFGNGLLTSDGGLHARQRRLMQPAFHRGHLDDYARVMTTLAVERCRRWREGDTIDIAREMSSLTLAITARILFGADGEDVAAQIGEALDTATRSLEVAVLPFAALTDLLPIPQARRFRAARATLDHAINDLIERRRRDCHPGGDMVSLLMSARDQTTGEGMSDSQIRDEIVTLLLASHETTANALAWTWYLLARHRHEDDRLHDEIGAVLGGRVPEPQNVGALPFTRMVLSESMRLYPPAWLLARVAVDNFEARGYVIPKGSLVVMSPWVVQRNGAYFSRPDEFEPERWRRDRDGSRPRFSYFPFGGGSRGCMGETFAWTEGVLLLTVFAQRWRFRLRDETSEPEIHPALTLMPKNGIVVQVAERLGSRDRAQQRTHA